MKNNELATRFEAVDDQIVAACATLRILGDREELPTALQLLAQQSYRSLVAALGNIAEIRDGVVTLEIKLSMAEEKIEDAARPF